MSEETTILNLAGLVKKESKMQVDQFLETWTMSHISSSTQEAEVSDLVDELILDGAREDMTPEFLEEAAGCSLEDYLYSAVSRMRAV